MNDSGHRTIRDFGEQWTRYRDNTGYYGSTDLFDDIFGPLLRADQLRGLRVCDIGAGTGRFVNVALSAGAAHVFAVEPSDAFDVLRENTRAHSDRVTYLRIAGADLPADLHADLVLSIGVLHHVEDPAAVAVAAFRTLTPGGRIGIWVYGREHNGLYLAAVQPLRLVTRALPHPLLAALVRVIDVPTVMYLRLCRRLRLPLDRYMTRVLGRMSAEKRRLVIYDQLNPQRARYYRRDAVEALLLGAGFSDVRLYHRHGYSWAATALKPADA